MSTLEKKYIPSFLIATGLGSGLAPKAPGTIGTLASLLLFSLFWNNFNTEGRIIFSTVLTAIAFIATKHLLLASRYREKKDPQEVVIDEWCGMAIAMLAVNAENLLELALAFTLFRLFDITKPGPVRIVESFDGAYGIILDDIVAGIFALGIFLLCMHFELIPAMNAW